MFFPYYYGSIKLPNTESVTARAVSGGKIMKITLLNTYSDSEHRLEEIENELQTLDEKLKTPERNVDELIDRKSKRQNSSHIH